MHLHECAQGAAHTSDVRGRSRPASPPPLCQTSCRLNRIGTLGARISGSGSIPRSVQRSDSGEAVAAGELVGGACVTLQHDTDLCCWRLKRLRSRRRLSESAPSGVLSDRAKAIEDTPPVAQGGDRGERGGASEGSGANKVQANADLRQGSFYAAASTAFQTAGVLPSLRRSLPRLNCPLWIRRSSLTPAIVSVAVQNCLKPSIGPMRSLTPRWSCSIRLFRYFDERSFVSAATTVRLKAWEIQLVIVLCNFETVGLARECRLDLDLFKNRHRKDLQQCVERRLQPEPFAHDRNQHIDRNGDPDLRLHGVLRRAIEPFDPQVLFDPFEKKLHLPAAFV